MNIRESIFKKKLMAQLKKIPNSWWESINQRSIIGTPDILGCVNSRFVALECKASEKARIAPIQAYKLDLIRRAEGIGEIVYPSNYIEIINRNFNIDEQAGIECINVCLPNWVIMQLDKEAERIGVTRQSLIKTWIVDRIDLEEAHNLPSKKTVNFR